MNILTSISVFVLIMALRKVSVYTQTCIQEYCFTTPDASQVTDFNGAKSWCTNNGSTLAVINDSDVQQAVTQFLRSSNVNSMAFINMKLYQHDNTWFLLNGSKYKGWVGNQATADYHLYCCLRPYGNLFQVDASQPSERNRYICEFQDTRCLNNFNDNIIYNGRCYVKYESVTLTWYNAREECINNGGDLATFQAVSYFYTISFNPEFNTSWLNLSFTYWVGIRWNDWRWITPDGGSDAIYTSWSSGEPNNFDSQCVCVDPNGNSVWCWTDCDCNQTRQFVCLNIVPTTTASTTTPATKASTISTTSEVIAINPNSTTNALAIGLGAGLGGGLFIIFLVVLIVVVVVVMRKRRRKNNGVESRREDENQRTPTTPNIELEASDRSEFYAHIVPTTQHPANTKSQNDVIYAKPEFPNSTPSGQDPNSILQGRVKSIMLEGPNDFYANAASVS